MFLQEDQTLFSLHQPKILFLASPQYLKLWEVTSRQEWCSLFQDCKSTDLLVCWKWSLGSDPFFNTSCLFLHSITQLTRGFCDWKIQRWRIIHKRRENYTYLAHVKVAANVQLGLFWRWLLISLKGKKYAYTNSVFCSVPYLLLTAKQSLRPLNITG